MNETYYPFAAPTPPTVASTPSPMSVDARVRGGVFTLCEFAGRQCDPDGQRCCKFYRKATRFDRCMSFRDETGHCDFVELTDKQYVR